MQISEPKVYTIYGEKHVLSPKHIALMRKNKLEMRHIRTRVKSGWTLNEAVSAPFGMRKKEYIEALKIKCIEGNRTKRKNHQKPKPWLKKYPQKTKFGEYAQKLFKECCGSW